MPNRFTITIIDDEETIRESLTLILEPAYRVITAADGKEAAIILEKEVPDLILLDIGLPDISGIDILKKIKKKTPGIPVIMITAFEEIDTVVAAMQAGAYDYLTKPLHSDTLEMVVRNALETVKLRSEVRSLQGKVLEEHIPCFIGESDAIQDMMEFVGLIAKSPDTPVLILGETGTGKELVASAIHHQSPRFRSSFVTVNCAAIPLDLMESEIFGYKKGAFSGANPGGKKGLIEEADGGTLFLDEIGDLSLEAQAKLLRFLETGEYYPIGDTRKHHVTTRVVSATNKNLGNMIRDNLFRRDLYFRIGVVKVTIPSLNQRRSDILPLADFFLDRFNAKFKKNITGFAPETIKALSDHDWTGNVRELKNLIERGTLVGKGPELSPGDLGLVRRASGTTDLPIPPILKDKKINLSRELENLERYYLTQAMELAKGNESKAARLLSMNHHTFRYRRKKLMGSRKET